MVRTAQDSLPNMFPCMSYRDAPAAIAWLAKAFGFTEHVVYRGPDGTIAHAEMSFGPGKIMLGAAKDEPLGMKSPRDVGTVTQSVYICLDEVDGHYERAKAAGAEILRELQDTDYGSREYSARDPEGHVWHFGTYRPQAGA